MFLDVVVTAPAFETQKRTHAGDLPGVGGLVETGLEIFRYLIIGASV